jgi:signal transduction histidine kinase
MASTAPPTATVIHFAATAAQDSVARTLLLLACFAAVCIVIILVAEIRLAKRVRQQRKASTGQHRHGHK